MTSVQSLYRERVSLIHPLHPLTKLAISGFIIAAGLVVPPPWKPYAVFFGIVIPIALLAKVLIPLVKGVFPVLLPFIISLTLVQGLFWPGGTPILHLGPLSFKEEGLFFMVVMVGRLAALISGFVMLTLTTRPDALMTALTERGLPESISFIVLMTLQIIPRFQTRAGSIIEAQQARGLKTGGSPLSRVKALLPLIGPLVLSSLMESEERAIALEARGFGRSGPKTSLVILHDTAGQKALRWGLLVIVIVLIVLRVVG